MAWDIATARTRVLGSAIDASKDDVITPAMSAAVAACEQYCDRGLLEQAGRVEELYEFCGTRAGLWMRPITSVTTVVSDSDSIDVAEILIVKDRSILVLPSYISPDVLTVTYTGGYSSPPADLEIALWGAFDSAYEALDAKGGLQSPVRSENVAGVGSVTYSLGSESSNFIGSASAALLQSYMRSSA